VYFSEKCLIFYMHHPHWRSKYNIYKYSQSEAIRL